MRKFLLTNNTIKRYNIIVIEISLITLQTGLLVQWNLSLSALWSHHNLLVIGFTSGVRPVSHLPHHHTTSFLPREIWRPSIKFHDIRYSPCPTYHITTPHFLDHIEKSYFRFLAMGIALALSHLPHGTFPRPHKFLACKKFWPHF